eukprot:CAMPEP_0119045294 /NCGR_PEP_ID=MMETSP1177-20130426/38762_1 /TAXON_ID=2985 /ORGANISM="Ochromonas sp, Strain CCMP1899" /LENGTH=279 /DNA_ID=CAMNT_0007016823 /DNA_START=128 /DNA_END=967 /DNA_ORIENTATION=-
MVVGPSTYAIEHEKSVLVSNIAIGDEGLGGEYAHYDKRLSIKSVVIPPSVDFDRFNPDMIGENDIIRHPKCRQQSAKTCINIGFVGRLAVEKNPGLFLMAAHTILSQDPTVCFTVIGDGDLLPYLRNLAVRLNISESVYFAGWRNEQEIPRLLKSLDMVVNPSLRAWSETFCIANIEVMSMEIPLITFAVGGIGEYVEDPQYMDDFDSTAPFSLSYNAVVVNIATTDAVASAVFYLMNNRTLMGSIGRAGRETVKAYFTIERQMRQYTTLYKQLMENKI